MANLKKTFLGLELFAICFGATVFVPLTTNIPPSVVLFTAGVSTLIMYFFGQGKYGAPIIFLGSSFAYISPILHVQKTWNVESVFFALGIAGVMKVVFSRIIKYIGSEYLLEKIFSPVVFGSMITLIGLTLVNTGLDMAGSNWTLALITLISAAVFMIFTRGLPNLFSVLIAVGIGYIVALISGNVSFEMAPLLRLPDFKAPQVNWSAALYMLPFALAPTIEHFGDIFAISEAADRPYYESPGIHRTMLIDGIGTMMSLVGSVPNTTYSEGVSAVNLLGIKDDKVSRNAGIWALIFSFVGLLSAFLNSIPQGVIGGVMVILFGSIATIGFKSFVREKVDFNDPRNIIIASTMFVFGLGNISIWKFNGVGLAALIGLSLQIIFLIFDNFIESNIKENSSR
uniref:Uracil-xanthine permease n=1 Tax=uncultured organism TaxID=155900 RepID=M1PW36_9ZZZZ|nr:uracil-xanthine permease [uncultured organism]